MLYFTSSVEGASCALFYMLFADWRNILTWKLPKFTSSGFSHFADLPVLEGSTETGETIYCNRPNFLHLTTHAKQPTSDNQSILQFRCNRDQGSDHGPHSSAIFRSNFVTRQSSHNYTVIKRRAEKIMTMHVWSVVSKTGAFSNSGHTPDGHAPVYRRKV